MNRREFIATGAAMGVAAGFAQGGDVGAGASPASAPHFPAPKQAAELNLCLQLWLVPADGGDEAKLDFLEANGFTYVEVPSGDWLFKHGERFAGLLKGRRLKLATACGPSDLSFADKARRDAEVERLLPMLDVLGRMGSTGLIICPARGKPELPHKELRESFVEDTGRRLARHAVECGTEIVLEPLCRGETPFLRQVADAASMARDIGPGAAVMGDFWHMSKEETSFCGAFLSAGERLRHVHIASLRRRLVPGLDGESDDYVDGFLGLKLLGYRGPISMECGWPSKGKDANGKDILPPTPERAEMVLAMRDLVKEQWTRA